MGCLQRIVITGHTVRSSGPRRFVVSPVRSIVCAMYGLRRTRGLRQHEFADDRRAAVGLRAYVRTTSTSSQSRTPVVVRAFGKGGSNRVQLTVAISRAVPADSGHALTRAAPQHHHLSCSKGSSAPCSGAGGSRNLGFSEFGYSLRVRESRIARLPDVCWAPDDRPRLCRCGSWPSSSTGG